MTINYSFNHDLIEAIALYLIAVGRRETTSGNYIFSFDEIIDTFKLTTQQFNKVLNDVYIVCLAAEAVSDIEIYDEVIDINFYTDYTPNIEE